MDITTPQGWGNAITAARHRWHCDTEEAMAILGALLDAQTSETFRNRFGTIAVRDVQDILRQVIR